MKFYNFLVIAMFPDCTSSATADRSCGGQGFGANAANTITSAAATATATTTTAASPVRIFQYFLE